MDDTAFATRLELAIDAARGAGVRTLEFFRKPDLAVELKADATPVTLADRTAEQHVRDRVAASFPDDGIVGEELPDKSGTSGFRWIIDPIDGTQSFIHGVPLYGTLVGVEHGGRSVIGVLVLPALDEYIYAADGHGAWHVRGTDSPVAARVSDVSRLADGLFVSETIKTFYQADRQSAYHALRNAAGLVRGWGDAFGYALVATGRAEVMVDPTFNIWDAAALQPILEESGGTFTDWKGNPTIHAKEGIATNGHVLDEVLAITRDA